MKIKFLLCKVPFNNRDYTQLIVFKKDSKGWFVYLISPVLWEIIRDDFGKVENIPAKLAENQITWQWIDGE
jgi:hypothetical protein